jgi:DNA/RNA endonuclease YhcR with UshA esterase domain
LADRIFLPAFAVSVFGLMLIVFISPSVKPPVSHVRDISASSLEKVVRFEGNVSKVQVFRGGSILLTVSDGGSDVDVFMSLDVASPYKGMKLAGRRVEVMGAVQVYKGRLEVMADKAGSVRLK